LFLQPIPNCLALEHTEGGNGLCKLWQPSRPNANQISSVLHIKQRAVNGRCEFVLGSSLLGPTLTVSAQEMAGKSNGQATDNAGSNVAPINNLTECLGHFVSGVVAAITYLIVMALWPPNDQSSGTRDQPA
jgi:hypothetical protein